MGRDTEKVRASKLMSLVLRHNPGAFGIALDGQGWVDIDTMVRASDGRLTDAVVRDIVATNDKQRFAISQDGTRIRANQGHSIDVDLELTPQDPPATLFHGTARKNRDLILRDGLKKMHRQHVHLSSDTDTARTVGQRNGAPVIFTVAARALHSDGVLFFRSANGVWLVDRVPPDYLSLAENDAPATNARPARR